MCSLLLGRVAVYYVRCGLLLPTEWSVVIRAKTAEAIEMPFGFRIRVGLTHGTMY